MSMIDLNIKVLEDKINFLDNGFSSSLYSKCIQNIYYMISSSPSLIHSLDSQYSFDITSTSLKYKLPFFITLNLYSFRSIDFLLLSLIRDFFTKTFDSHFMKNKLFNFLNISIVKICLFKKS
jgi:hypothetical protein